MSTIYSVTNSEIRADAEVTRKQSFAGIPHTGTIAQPDRLYLPAHTEIVVTFGGRIPDLRFSLGNTPAWADTVVAAIRKSASYQERLAQRTNKAEPCISYTGRALKRTPQPPMRPATRTFREILGRA